MTRQTAVTFPATCTVEPDFRVPTAEEPYIALCPERYPLDKLARLEKRSGAYYWAALYQQRPRPQEGDAFKYDDFKFTDVLPAGPVFRVRYWDLAGTADAGDYTSGARLSLSADLRITIEHVARGQWSVNRRDQKIKATADADRKQFGPGMVAQWIESESGVGGADRTLALVRLLQGHVVHTEPATGDKALRAEPLASQVAGGNVTVVKGDWPWAAVLDVLCDFPNGATDDDVDACSGAYNKLAAAFDSQFTFGRFKS